MQITAHTTPSVFQSLAPEWDALVANAVTGTPFQLTFFQKIWWSHLGSGQLLVLAVHADDALVGLAPLFIDSDGVLRWVGGEEIADYLDVIATEAHQAEVQAAVFAWLTSADCPAWQHAQLSNIPSWSTTAANWQARATDAGLTAEVTQIDVSPAVPLPADFDAYMAQIAGKQRREIRRKRRRAEANEDTRWHFVPTDADIAEATENFFDLMASSHPEKAEFLERPHMRPVFTELLAAAHQNGLLSLSFLEVNGENVATYFAYDFGGRIWLYNSGLAPQKAASLSAGWVLLTYIIEDAIQTEHTVFDFMQGDEDYKYKFGGQDTLIHRLTITR